MPRGTTPQAAADIGCARRRRRAVGGLMPARLRGGMPRGVSSKEKENRCPDRYLDLGEEQVGVTHDPRKRKSRISWIWVSCPWSRR